MTYTLVETMLLQPGGLIRHLQYHLARLERSCLALNYPFQRTAIQQQLAQLIATQSWSSEHKVRLLYNQHGVQNITAESYAAPTGELQIQLITEPMPAFPAEQFKHKFTDSPLRAFYRSAAPAQAYDSLFVNADGVITEGARTNFYIKLDGALLTSPLALGVLPGTYRAQLLEKGCEERPITQQMLKVAECYYVSNALIGLRKVRLRDN